MYEEIQQELTETQLQLENNH